ncbi:MAG TPA: HXXEE domain-containing protein [Acidisphaera sp.]|nr:HXXEE domain-containing protein [Acidisphaera sp.]
MKDWLATHWVIGALFMAGALLAVAPLVAAWGGLGVLLIYLAGPGYMLHQIEEHTGDRFRRWVNERMFGGREALTVGGVLWINLPGVWGVNLAALYAAWLAGPQWGLAAPYLMLVNAVAHIGSMARQPGYNPGLATGVVVFLPLSLVTLWSIPAGVPAHVVGLAVSLAFHAAIIVHVSRRAAALAPA